jgi:hypothetical protein
MPMAPWRRVLSAAGRLARSGPTATCWQHTAACAALTQVSVAPAFLLQLWRVCVGCSLYVEDLSVSVGAAAAALRKGVLKPHLAVYSTSGSHALWHIPCVCDHNLVLVCCHSD